MPSIQQLCVALLIVFAPVNGSPLQLAGSATSPAGTSRPLKARADKPSYIPKMPDKCLTTTFNNADDQKKAWQDSNAGGLADAFIHNNDMKLENWVQNLFKLIFPGKDPSIYSCVEDKADCGPVPECKEFEEAGYVGGYYLFKSISSSHAYLSGFKLQVLSNAVRETLAIDKVVSDFHYKPPPQNPSLPVGYMISASFGALSGATFAVGPVSGAFGVLSAVSSLFASATSKTTTPQVIDQLDVQGSLSKMVDSAFSTASDGIDKILKAMYSGGDQHDIPSMMQKETWQYEALRALGDGQWLMDNPTNGLSDLGAHMVKQMRQALAWQMIRLGREGFVVLNTAVNKDDCNKSPNGVWSDKRFVCFDLFYMKAPTKNYNQQIDSFGDDIKPLWNEYGMDKLATYENSAECWEANNGNMGDPGYVKDPTNLGLTQCTFGMDVRKGGVFVVSKSLGKAMGLDMSWPGQDKTKMACEFPCVGCKAGYACPK